MNFKQIIIEKRNGIAKIILNRPEALNAITQEMVSEMKEALGDIEKDDTVKVVVITGKGRAFCAGADLKEAKEFVRDVKKSHEFLSTSRTLWKAIEDLSKPVIAAVNGLAFAGGLELLLTCDLAIASKDARIGDQHANYGLIAGGGSSQRLPRCVGIRKAKELLLTGDWISAEEAEKIGLINKAVPADRFDEAVNEMASKIASKSSFASAAIKALVNRPMQAELSLGLELELETATVYFATSPDAKEGFEAFEQKRQPRFR